MGDVMKKLLSYSLLLIFLGIIVFLNPFNFLSEATVHNKNLDYEVTTQEERSDGTKESEDNSLDDKNPSDEIDASDNNNSTAKDLKKTKYVALTFDDGPSEFTSKIIDLLEEYGYNATFFVLGNKLNLDYQKTLKKSITNGNEIGVHGYSHRSFTKMTKESIEEEISKTKKYVKNLTGYEPKLVRPPYGNITKTIKNYNFGPYILWNNDTLDWKLRDAKKIYERLTSSIEDKSVILMHDTYLTTYKALEIILPYLKENNYEVTTISKIYELNSISLESNKSYRYVR